MEMVAGNGIGDFFRGGGTVGRGLRTAPIKAYNRRKTNENEIPIYETRSRGASGTEIMELANPFLGT